MLEYLILAAAGFALWHFIVDGIISADWQLATRAEAAHAGQELDRLREKKPQINSRGYHLVRDALVGLVRHPAAYTLWSFCIVQHNLRRDGEMQRQVAERQEILSTIDDPDLVKVRDNVPHFAFAYLTINSLGWAIYVVPVAIALIMYHKTKATIMAVVNMPEQQLSKIDRGPRTAFDKCFG